MVNLEEFKYGGTNVTAFRMVSITGMLMMISYYEIWDGYILKQKVDPENPSVRETLQLWQQQVLSFEFYCLKKKTAKNL